MTFVKFINFGSCLVPAASRELSEPSLTLLGPRAAPCHCHRARGTRGTGTGSCVPPLQLPAGSSLPRAGLPGARGLWRSRKQPADGRQPRARGRVRLPSWRGRRGGGGERLGAVGWWLLPRCPRPPRLQLLRWPRPRAAPGSSPHPGRVPTPSPHPSPLLLLIKLIFVSACCLENTSAACPGQHGG